MKLLKELIMKKRTYYSFPDDTELLLEIFGILALAIVGLGPIIIFLVGIVKLTI